MKNVLFFLVILLTFSCKQTVVSKELEWSNEISTTFNKLNAKEEELDINLYLARKPTWKMIKTGSGLRYEIYQKENKGTQVNIGNIVEVQYKVELLDGEVVDQTKDDEVEEFVVDRAQIETGIQEAIKLMKEGERARLVIPSHLAHGIVGDLSKIPPISILVVDLYLHRVHL